MEMSGRPTRDEEARRGNILRRKRDIEGGRGYLGNIKNINRDREMVI